MTKKYPKLPVRFKAKWIKALRSGKYKQGYYRLYSKSTNSYCCLGVACVVSGLEEKQISRYGMIPKSFKKNHANLPTDLIESNALTNKLVNLNDSGYSFKRIASWIEKTL